MRHQRGFTLVELLIVIVIMSVLLVLATVNLRSGQITARDQERKTDVENIARSLESTYTTYSSNGIGVYPSLYISDPARTEAEIKAVLQNIDVKSLRAPDYSSTTGFSLVSAAGAGATNETTTGVTPQPTTAQYVYQPFQTDNVSLCTTTLQQCRRFNIYYRLEGDSTVYKVSSKNQ